MKALTRLTGMAALFAALILSQGCATIFGGRTNTMVFSGSDDFRANVFIDDTLVGEAPGKIVLPKQTIQHGSMLEIRAEGYQTQEYLILRKPHTLYMISDFVFGAAPLIVDCATGNLLRPSPRKFDLHLSKQE
jgi:hypothetical protein